MCGRFQLTLPAEALQRIFAVDNPVEPFPPRYNIAPTQPVHVVRRQADGTRAIVLMRWGLLPSWVKDPNDFPLLINARSESAATKPAFRAALRRRRVLLPATGFYEWKKGGPRKIPYLFEQDGPFALAGMAETWHGPNGEEMDTVCVLTGAARGVPAEFHDRMPLTVPQAAFAPWLDPSNEDGAAALALTAREDFTARPVSIRLSNARNEGAALMEPEADAKRGQGRRHIGRAHARRTGRGTILQRSNGHRTHATSPLRRRFGLIAGQPDSGRTRPGLMRPCGSRAFLMARIMSCSTSLRTVESSFCFIRPTPCSAAIDPS